MHRGSSASRWLFAAAAAAIVLSGCSRGQRANATGLSAPVYVHMNGANDFLESVVAVRPGQPVVFVNQDTDAHTIVGYDPTTGMVDRAFSALVAGTPGPGHPVATATFRFTKPGVYPYYCSLHARLVRTYGRMVQPARRIGINGFGGVMAGVVIVTNDPALLHADPPTASRRILSDFFGG